MKIKKLVATIDEYKALCSHIKDIEKFLPGAWNTDLLEISYGLGMRLHIADEWPEGLKNELLNLLDKKLKELKKKRDAMEIK